MVLNFLVCELIRFETVLKRRRAVRETREEGADRAISSEALGCSERREEVNCWFNKRLSEAGLPRTACPWGIYRHDMSA